MTDVRPVGTPRELDAFIRLPWDLYRGDPNWVPPLISAERKLLDTARNPFWSRAQARHFLARRDGRLVGRISAIVNQAHNATHNEKAGWFGFFETENDGATARALLDAAEDWLRAQGATRALGPVNPSTNDPSGMLIEGYDRPPYVLMTYNPAHYPPLVDACGYRKSMDLLAYSVREPELVRGRLDRIVRLAGERSDVQIREVDLSRFEDELRLVMSIYNDAWAQNWGFTPMSEDEIRFVAGDMKAIVLPEFAYFATHRGETIAFALALPDINVALQRVNGRLFPFGWIRFLKRNLRKIKRFRVVALGVKRQWQHLGVGPLFYQRLMDTGLKRGYVECEMSWVLENNDMMNRPLVMLGAKPYKRYRIYEKAL
jgi:GNAT superfamily N-acetyltransferase